MEQHNSPFQIVVSGDPRARNLLLVSDGKWVLFVLLAAYLLFSTVIGPKIMSNYKPFKLRWQLFVYNIFLVIINSYFFIESILAYDYGKELLNFQFPTDYNDVSPKTMRKITFIHWYFISKLIDLMDTVFFVLRKKDSQVTPLHLYHHASVPVCVWLALKYAPSAGVNGIFPIFNSLVHVLMYSYYALTTFGPWIHKYLWWKKYLTMIQLVQFAIFFTYSMTYVIKQTGWPSFLIITSVMQPPLYLFMFTSFYCHTYCSQDKNSKNKVLNGNNYKVLDGNNKVNTSNVKINSSSDNKVNSTNNKVLNGKDKNNNKVFNSSNIKVDNKIKSN